MMLGKEMYRGAEMDLEGDGSGKLGMVKFLEEEEVNYGRWI